MELISVRCSGCRQLICKQAPDAIRPERFVEIKCAKCNALNYLQGTDKAVGTPARTREAAKPNDDH